MLESTTNKLRKLEPNKADYVSLLNTLVDQLDAALTPDFIAGLQLEWVSASSVRVGTGSAWVSGTGRLKVSAAITVSSISLGASAWGHVYLYSNTGAAAVEVVTTAPVSAGFGSAYQKTGDATRRYLGSVRTDGSGNILNFYHYSGNRIRYRTDINTQLVLNNGTATAEANVSCAGFVPVTSRVALLHLMQSATNATNLWLGAGTGASDDSVAPPTTALGVVGTGGQKDWMGDVLLNASQQFSYAYSVAPTGGGGYAYVYGYMFDR